MTTRRRYNTGRGELGRVPAFTLIELLVVMAIIAIIGSIVTVAFSNISREARLSSGTNLVISAIGNARALAMKNNRLVMVAFRSRLTKDRSQIVEIITAEWSGETFVDNVNNVFLDRFILIEDMPIRIMPKGIKVAGPMFGESTSMVTTDADFRDDNWATQAQLTAIDQSNHLSNNSEPAGRIIAIMFNPDGTPVSANPASGSNASFIDMNRDREQTLVNFAYDFFTDPSEFPGEADPRHYLDDDEPVVSIVPFLAVFDDEEFRRIFDPGLWLRNVANFRDNRDEDLSLYINENANRIHFNSYTGVAMR